MVPDCLYEVEVGYGRFQGGNLVVKALVFGKWSLAEKKFLNFPSCC